MFLICVIVSALPCIMGFAHKTRIGGLFEDDEMIQRAFELSARAVSKRIATSASIRGVSLAAVPAKVNTDAYWVSKEACDHFYYGVAGIFGPQDKLTSVHVQSMCDTMNIPYMSARWDPEQKRGNVINLYPHASILSQVYADLIREFKWKRYAVLYTDTDSLVRMNRVIELQNIEDHNVMLYHLGSGPNFRKALLDIKSSDIENLVIDCSTEDLPLVLEQCLQVGLFTNKRKMLITSLDLQTIDLEPYRHAGTNVTGVRLIDPENPIVREILGSRSLNWSLAQFTELRVVPALTYDAVQIFARGLLRLKNSVKGNVKQLFCNASDAWDHGYSLSNFIRAEEVRGLSGLVKFDTAGFRTDFQLDVVQLGRTGLDKIAEWHDGNLRWVPAAQHAILSAEKALYNRHFIVLISLTEPFGMLRKSADMMTGNDRYEGFAIDIIEEISKRLGFNYTFQVEQVYGSYNRDTKSWNGMVKKLMDGEADLAITDLTITAERESAVDFTTPFMNLGISILYTKPTKSPPSWLSFLLPYHMDIWVHVIGAYIVVTVVLFFVGRLCPEEWTNRYPCIKEPEELQNPFTIKETPFFIIGSLLKSPTGFAPAGISTRTIGTAWAFFCLIMCNTYTANLAAALSTKSVDWPFTNVEGLAYHKTIKYGAKLGGSTLAFFRTSTYPPYHHMYKEMMEHADELLPRENDDGVAKVQQDMNYAFLMESTSIEYVQRRRCNVTQVGGLLDAKGYGIAMKKNADFRTELSGAILRLKEIGTITELRHKWWNQKRGGDACEVKGVVRPDPLFFEDVGGVFLILVSGVMLGWLPTIGSLLWHVRQVAVKENVPFKEKIVSEIRFLLSGKGTKVIKPRKLSVSGKA